MKKLVIVATVISITLSSLNAGGFEKRFKMMDSRIKSKMEKYKDNAKAMEFLNNKLSCIKMAKDEKSLKGCKKKFHPKTLKKIVKG